MRLGANSRGTAFTAAPDVYLPGQVFRPVDIAFGGDGRVYSVGERVNNAIVEIFEPF